MLELAAIWIIVGATLAWFVRDERRVREASLQASVRHFATSDTYRHRPARVAVAVPEPVRRTAGISPAQRRFFEAYMQSGKDS